MSGWRSMRVGREERNKANEEGEEIFSTETDGMEAIPLKPQPVIA